LVGGVVLIAFAAVVDQVAVGVVLNECENKKEVFDDSIPRKRNVHR
jgi:hypothetical protein